MSARFLQRRAGRHAADPITQDTPQAGPPVTREAVAAGLHARRDLTAQAGRETTVIPALQLPSGPPMRADYQTLPVFRAAVRAGAGAGWRHLGTRTALLAVPPGYDYGITTAAQQCLAAIAADWRQARREVLADADAAQEHADSGFRSAHRVFHSEAEIMLGHPAGTRAA